MRIFWRALAFVNVVMISAAFTCRPLEAMWVMITSADPGRTVRAEFVPINTASVRTLWTGLRVGDCFPMTVGGLRVRLAYDDEPIGTGAFVVREPVGRYRCRDVSQS